MLEIVIEHYKPIGKILIYTIALLVIFLIIFFNRIRNYMLDNWDYYRGQVWVLPIAGFIKPEPGLSSLQTTVKNFYNILGLISKNFMQILMTPIYPIMELFNRIFKSSVGILDGIRQQMNVMRNFLFKLFEGMYTRIEEGMAGISFFFLKLREGLKRSYGTMNLLLSTVQHANIFMQTLIRSPIGRFGDMAEKVGFGINMFVFGPLAGIPVWRDSLCFNPYTLIEMNNNSIRYISTINTGDILKNNNRIIAKIISEVSTPMYNLNDIEVSGDHVVKYEKDNDISWIRVKNHPDASLVKYNEKHVVCLVTSEGIIELNNTIFKDYLDTHSINKYVVIRHLIEQYLNGSYPYMSSDKCVDFISGFSPIHKVSNTDIIGTVYIGESELDLYDINGKLFSGNLLIERDGIWIRVCDHPNALYLGKNREKLINYITKSKEIIFNDGTKVRDFTEMNDETLATILDNFVDNTSYGSNEK